MLRLGRIRGWEYVHREMDWFWIRCHARPSNATKRRGRCGRARCQMCHVQPWNKALKKTKGEHKRLRQATVPDDWVLKVGM